MVAEQWPLERAACQGPGPDGGRGLHASFTAAAPEGPAVTAADREDVLGRILDARSAGAALLGSDELPGAGPAMCPAEGLERYRRLVRLAHPDRCTDRRAHSAFLRASSAFDSLCAVEAGQPAHFEGKESVADVPSGSRWWASRGAEELERFLEHRAAVLQALQAWADTLPAASVQAGVERLWDCCLDAARACEHLDRRSGIRRHRLWLRVPSAAASPQQSAVLLADLILHLRAVHRFCPLRHLAFDHPAELEVACPTSGVKIAIHEVLAAEPRSAETIAPDLIMQDQDSSDVVDPLDAYMAIVMGELKDLPCTSAGKAVEIGSTCQVGASVLLSQQRPIVVAPSALVCASMVAVPFGHQQAGGAPENACGQLSGPTTSKGLQSKVNEVRLATGSVVPLATAAAATPMPGLQEQLLGGMDSDGSELDN